jgi:hypothetical protein
VGEDTALVSLLFYEQDNGTTLFDPPYDTAGAPGCRYSLYSLYTTHAYSVYSLYSLYTTHSYSLYSLYSLYTTHSYSLYSLPRVPLVVDLIDTAAKVGQWFFV